MSHTPGPWNAVYTQLNPVDEQFAFCIATDRYDVVSGDMAIQNEADATLIAAAPDMLEALEALLNRIQHDKDAKHWFVEEQIMARNAIAKAKGE